MTSLKNNAKSALDVALTNSLKGFLDPREGRRLYELALGAVELGPCLEIGSYCGKSAVYLGTACRARGGVLFSIDHHGGSEEQQPGEEYFDPQLFNPRAWRVDTLTCFRRTLRRAGLEETVVPLVCASQVAARSWATPLGLLFIDGGHALTTVTADYTAWARHVVSGGYVIFHDIFTDPAQGGQAPWQVYRAALDGGGYRELPQTVTLGILQRV